MKSLCAALLAAAAAVTLVACGSDSTTSAVASVTTRGTLVQNPPLRVASLDAASFQAELGASSAGAQLLQLTGAPVCGVDFYYLKFWTVGGAAESTQSSGALMVPTGAAPGCSGPRPRAALRPRHAEQQAAQPRRHRQPRQHRGRADRGDVRRAGLHRRGTNYAGYDTSTLGYHPFLNAIQQSDEMIDILAAARAALPHTFSAATKDSGALLVAGYSEGGHVAVATVKALEAAGQSVTAASGGSGPYALEAFGDAIMFGSVNIGSTEFAPLLTTSYQHEYGNLYGSPSDLYSSTYASGIETVLPNATPIDTLFAQNKLPQTALFDSTPPTVTVPGNTMLSMALTAALAVPAPNSSPQAPSSIWASAIPS